MPNTIVELDGSVPELVTIDPTHNDGTHPIFISISDSQYLAIILILQTIALGVCWHAGMYAYYNIKNSMNRRDIL